MEALPDGTFRLIPVALIPKHQLWAWRPDIQANVAKASKETGIALDSAKGQAFLRKLDGK